MKPFSILFLFFTFHSLSGQTEFTFVFLNKKENKEELPKERVDELMKGHMANIDRLANEGKLVAAGPFEGGGGIFVFKSNSIVEVEEWLSTDPGVKAKRWDIEILPFQSLVGSICKVGEDYEMVNYHFIRFWPEVKKSTVRETPELIAAHETYWKKFDSNTLVAFTSFGGEQGDIIISRQPVEENILVNDPSISKGLMRFNKKVLWIAKGSFCEK